MFASQLSRVCGTGPSPSSRLEVSPDSTNVKPETHISSAEAFAATGWRIGWLIGPESIIKPTLAATTRIVFCSNSPLQEAAAYGLEQARSRKFFETQVAEYTERRSVLLAAFDRLGLKYSLPEGTYFVLVVRTG